MPRRGAAPKRTLPQDPVFGSRTVQRFINKLMVDGRKSAAERIFYAALEMIQDSTGSNPLDIFTSALQNVMPQVEVRPRRVGGQTYQVPVEVDARRQVILGVRWLVEASRQRPEHTMVERVANELMDAANNEGVAKRRQEEIARMAQANKAYAHYRW